MKNNLGICTKYEDNNIVKNGHNGSGKQQYLCKTCGARRILESEKKYNESRKGEITRAYFERTSLRGLERIFHVSRQTVSGWLKKLIDTLPTIEETLIEVKDDVLEMDETCSFVQKKINKRWLWLALSRSTKQVVTYFIGDRITNSCKRFEENLENSRKLKSSTLIIYKSCINNHLVPFFEKYTLEEINEETTEKFRIFKREDQAFKGDICYFYKEY